MASVNAMEASAQMNIPSRTSTSTQVETTTASPSLDAQRSTLDAMIPPRRTERVAPLPVQRKDSPIQTVGGEYQPRYTPEVITLTPQQVESVRNAMISRTLAEHEQAAAFAREQIGRHQYEIQRLRVAKREDAWAFEHRRASYERHAADSVWIFVLTLLIVALGLFLTLWQFTREQRTMRAVLKPLTRAGGEVNEATYKQALELLRELRGTTNLKLGSAGVELGTQIIGLVVLAFSLGFFYLFLVHVYPLIGG
jgi:hypothetical protein